MGEVIKVRCIVCDKVYQGIIPKGGTGDERHPRRHSNTEGNVCVGIYEPGIWDLVTRNRRDGGGGE